MDYKNFSCKNDLENVLLQSLKSRINRTLGDEIVTEVHKFLENDPHLSAENLVENISKNISSSEAFSTLHNTFIQDVDSVLNKDGKEETLNFDCGEIQTDSLTGSVSSLNNSVDFLSTDQLNEISEILLNSSSSLQKLEALETLSRLSTLEQLVKQTLWPSIESGLHKLMTNESFFLREGGFKIFIKMLASPEPHVVKESFLSLVKFLLTTVLPNIEKICHHQTILDYKIATQVIEIINRFQQHIPTYWLRYPQKVVEDIVSSSVNILEFGSNASNGFSVWKCVALFDLESKWIKHFMYGNISRMYMLNAFQKHLSILQFAVHQCEMICSSEKLYNVSAGQCCKKNSTVYEAVHMVCFLSHFLQYSETRVILSNVFGNSLHGLVSAFKIIVQSAEQLCEKACFKCCLPITDTLSQKLGNLWNSKDVLHYNVELIEILISPVVDFDLEKNIPPGKLCLLVQCLCEIMQDSSGAQCFAKIKINDKDLVFLLLQYFSDLACILDLTDSFALRTFYFSLRLVRCLISAPLGWLSRSNVIENLIRWYKNNWFLELITKLHLLNKENSSLKTEIERCEHEVQLTCFEYFKRPVGVMLYYKAGYFSDFLSLLIDKIFRTLPCFCDLSILTTALSYSFGDLSVKNILKLSAAVWKISSVNSSSETFQMLENILKNLVPAISDKFLHLDIEDDINVSTGFSFMLNYVLLFPSVDRNELYMCEDNVCIALNTLSLLVCCVQNNCVLQSKFHIQNALLEALSEFTLSDGNYVIDPVSVLLNHVLVRLFVVGGPTETTLPPKTLLKAEDSYPWSFVKTYPLSNEYQHSLCYNEELISLGSDKLIENELNLQHEFLDHLKLFKVTERNFAIELLSRNISFLSTDPVLTKTIKRVDVESLDKLFLHGDTKAGIDLAVRYGTTLNIVEDKSESKLYSLVKMWKICFEMEDSMRFDVFIATVFLIFKGDHNAVQTFLEKFAMCRTSIFIWAERAEQLLNSKESDLSWTQAILFDCCDFIVRDNLPSIFSAFQLCGTLPSVLFKYWIGQCFWNYLDWKEICNFIVLSVLFGGDYAIYFFVSILKHLKITILKHAHDKDIINHLKRNVILGYSMATNMDYIAGLADAYHCSIIETIDQYIRLQEL